MNNNMKRFVVKQLCEAAGCGEVGDLASLLLYKAAPVVPDEPAIASHYLYGTPSESGNVALADGEGYVIYNGAVLPKLPEWDKAKYPYAVVQYIDSALSPNSHIARVICASEPIIWRKVAFFTGGLGLLGDVLYFGLVDDIRLWEYVFPEVDPTTPINTWAKSGEAHFDELKDFNSQALASGFKWANHDVMNTSKNEVFIAASDPIPLASAEPVAAVYGGALPVASKWDIKKYPYVIVEGNPDYGNSSAYVYASTKPLGSFYHGSYIGDSISAENKEAFDYVWGQFWKNSAANADVEYKNVDGSTQIIAIGKENIIWANYDYMDWDAGTVLVEASDSIPVYEKKE